jgi:hypothetical protein
MAAHNIAHAAYQGPSVIKEIFYGIGLSLMGHGWLPLEKISLESAEEDQGILRYA